MKIEITGKNSYLLFINSSYINIDDFKNKESISIEVKRIIEKLRNRLKLRGFYKVRVFPHEKVGLFVEIIKLEDLELSNVLDLRIIVYLDENIFFETDDFFVINKYNNIHFYNGKFYCLIDNNFDEIFEIVEFGRFIYGDEALKLINNSIKI